MRERAEEFGRDGQKLLTAVWAADAPGRLRMLRQVEILRRVWVHQYYWDREGQLRWREGTALPPASLRFDSPYDPDAHYHDLLELLLANRGAVTDDQLGDLHRRALRGTQLMLPTASKYLVRTVDALFKAFSWDRSGCREMRRTVSVSS